MPHPVHAILKRLFDIDRFTFDATASEFGPSGRHEAWPSERFVQTFVGHPFAGAREPRPRDAIYREREPQS